MEGIADHGCRFSAVLESTKHIFYDLLGCESFHATAKTIVEIIVKKRNIRER